MYEELVKRLREATGWKNASEHYSLMKEAADAIEELSRFKEECDGCSDKTRSVIEKLQNMIPHWIPVTERLPENCGEYIVYLHSFTGGTLDDDMVDWGYTRAMYFDKGQSLWASSGTSYNAVLSAVDTGTEYHITHWMPLPEPPKEET